MTAVPRPLHFLALGDSYTIGEAVPAVARWPVVLVKRLRQTGVVIDDPHIVAVTGWTTDELAHGMDEATLGSAYDLVTLQIGVNNQYRGRTADDYRAQFNGLQTRAIALAGGRSARVVVVSIPDWGVTRFAREQDRDPGVIAAALDAFNAIAREQVERAGAHFVDITPISRRHPDLLAEDGLHPSAAQYARWLTAIFPVVRAALY
jgi:lysophospholipase L1-like esterase